MDNCIAPTQVQEGDFSAYLAGEAPATFIRHLEECPACRATLQALQAADRLAHDSLYRAACPGSEMLLRYEAGFLEPTESDRIAAHLETCAHCRQEVTELMAISEESVDAPESLQQQLKAAGKQILQAILQPQTPQLNYALRGTDSASRRYQAGDYRVTLNLVAPRIVGAAWQIEGQIIHHNLPLAGSDDTRVQLRHQADQIQSDVIDDLGIFFLEDVPTGQYTLQIDLPDTCIVIEDFSLS